MSIYQDHFASLSELERLAAMVQDPVRVHEIGADQWPMAMMAFGLLTSNDPDRLPEVAEAYGLFVAKTTPADRKASLTMLRHFISARKGEGWRALLPYALCEPDAALARKGGLLAATLAKPEDCEAFPGVAVLVDLLLTHPNAPAALLESVLGLSDMRFLPYAEKLYAADDTRLYSLLSSCVLVPNRLSCTWLTGLLRGHPSLVEAVTAQLMLMPRRGNAVLDIIVPIPSWAFGKPAAQPLHGWTLSEYFPRMAEALRPHLSPQQMDAVRAAFGA